MKAGRGLSVDFLALELDQAWGRDPGWFRTQSRESKAELMAHWRVKQGQ